MSCFNKFLIIVISITYISPVQADNLGRLFTSVEERQKLEKLRLKKEPENIVIEAKDEIEKPKEPVVKKEIINRDAISLKGLVHRSDGKSTAWINDMNTFEGNLDSHSIRISDDSISSDKVTIIMSDDSKDVELRVGDVYIPDPLEREVTGTESGM